MKGRLKRVVIDLNLYVAGVNVVTQVYKIFGFNKGNFEYANVCTDYKVNAHEKRKVKEEKNK